jgi:putative ABC transport system permease protein
VPIDQIRSALVNGLRYAFRHLRFAPGYTLVAALTFALAIGANGAVFSAVRAVLLRPLPVVAQDDVAVVWQTDEGSQAVVELTYRHWREWAATTSTFTAGALMASHNWSGVLQGRGEPSRLWFAGVSGTFFDVLGVQALHGRTLGPGDDVPNGPRVAVLNHAAWVRRFGADPGIVGTAISLDGQSIEIVGVMPPGLDIPRGAEFWTPAAPIVAGGPPSAVANLDTFGVFYVIGRLRPGLGAAGARAELDAAEARLDRDVPGRLKWGTRAVVTSLPDYVFGPVRPALWALSAAVVLLLLIACANVSGLMLTRVARRRREHGVRLALGASPRSIGGLWLAEIGLIATIGAVAGLAIAAGLVRLIVALAPDDLPRLGDIAVSLPVAASTFGCMLVAAGLTSVMPIRRARAVAPLDAISAGRGSTDDRRVLRARSGLSVLQIAVAVVLLVGMGLVVRGFVVMSRTDLGFSPERVLSATVQPRGAGVPPNQWLNSFLQRVRGLPGVEAAGAVYLRPLVLGPIGQGVHVFLEGQPETRESADANPTLNHQIASPGYFETMRIALRAGRFFTERDTTDAPRVAIVGESTARRLWPGRDPIGRRLLMASFRPGAAPRAWRTVVGVVADVRYHGLEEVRLDVYDPALQVGRPADNIVVRAAGDPSGLAGPLRALARALDSGVVVDHVTTMDAVVRRAQAPWRLSAWLFVLFGGLALGLAALGLFALVALDVSMRRREIAIRVALGATRGRIVSSVLGRAGWRVLAGVSIGMAAALVATRGLRGLLVGVDPLDGVTYGGVLVVLLATAAFSAWLPARRAASGVPHLLKGD